MAELNLARLYEEAEYWDWLYDYLDGMPESDEKKLALELLKEPFDDTDISDDMFKSLYGTEDEVENIKEISPALTRSY